MIYDPGQPQDLPTLRAAVEAAAHKARTASFQFDLARGRLDTAEKVKACADADLRAAKYRLEQAEKQQTAPPK